MYRLALTGVAIGPAFLAALLPAPAIGVPIALAIGGMGSLYALMTSLRGRKARPRPAGPVLLRRASLRRRDNTLPSTTDQRLALADALAAAVDLRAEPEAPPTRETAIARILGRILDSWKVTDLAELPPDLTIALTQLERLLKADPGEAGRIAQMFQRPDVVLSLRDEIEKIAEARATYDRAFAAFQATRLMYAASPKPGNLTEALQSLGTVDRDLWHRIVLEHDPTDPAQRSAALWCVSQPECDRATVAAYLSSLPEEAQLQNAEIDGDLGFLGQVRRIIDNCNAGIYRKQELAYSPDSGSAAALARELDGLAVLNREPRWPDPQCLFVLYEGRDPRPRPAWDIALGRLVAAPNRADYL
ncbi:hypothetical protein KZZ07_00385 [Mameliella sp. CS4]|uniref:hypothetical protein n=1 Tax=Mameliella sp. CS4 TaxID=2862329 RepID=UPI001C5FBBF3|nr:hypothetical protein [Mameliella sp. CS4]MBW4980983.1 hypothetical protein [Mameliella sp. CS4]